MKFTGTMPALITPLCEDESINVPVLRSLLGHLLEEGADGFYIGGATGEGIALRREEREILAEESIRFVAHRKPCIVHIASTLFSDAIALAKQAEKCGADAISAIPPMFFAYSEDDVYDYYKALADAVHIPLMMYYNPGAGFTVNAEFAARCFEIDNVTAIKWTSSDYFGLNRVKQLTNGEMNVINGPDEMLLMGLAAGADGGIGSTYNVMLPRIHSIYENFVSGNMAEAQKHQTDACRVIKAILRRPCIPVVKALLEKQGYAVGNAAFPQRRFSPEEKAQIWKEVSEAGL